MKSALSKELLSIIVPVYNVEEYLPRCIDSILSQTFTNFELILVDDGSTDSSGEICEKYANRESRIKVIHKENAGLSSARNAGLDKCCGKYIMFIDSDDCLGTCDTIEKNITLLNKYDGVGLVQFPTQWFYGSENDVILGLEDNFFPRDLMFQALSRNKITTTAWDKIYSREVFRSVRFPDGRYYEDSYAIIDILSNVDYVLISKMGYYKYCIRQNSIIQSQLTKKKVEDFLAMTIRLMTKAISIKETELYRVHTFLEMEDKLAFGKSFLEKDLLERYCNQISRFIPEYRAIFSYIFQKNMKKGIKVLIIKFVRLKNYLRFK